MAGDIQNIIVNGGLVIPKGNNTTDKPSPTTSLNGLIRYNSTSHEIEVIINGAYTTLFTGSSVVAAGAGGVDGQIQINNGGVLDGVDVTGTGNVVRATSPTITSPTLVTAALGTPTSGTLTNCTGLQTTGGGTGLSTTTAYSLMANNTATPGYLLTTQNIIVGAPGYSDINFVFQNTKASASYIQSGLQNTTAGAASSADYIVANDRTTASTYYLDLGINSSAFSGSGSFNIAGGSYLYSQGQDLAIGTTTANSLHFVVNNGITDALTVSSAGNVGIGTSTPNTNLSISLNTTALPTPLLAGIQLGGSNSADVSLEIDSFGGTAPSINCRGARGTAASKTATQSGDILSAIRGYGYGSTSYVSASSARITMYAAETWTDLTSAAYISMFTKPSNLVGSAVERLRIDKDGNVGIGSAPTGTYLLDVVKDGVNQACFRGSGTNGASISLDSAAASKELDINFNDAGTTIWSMLKTTGNLFYLYDRVNGKANFTAAPNGDTTVGCAGNFIIDSTGNATTLTQTAGDNTTRIATTAFVTTAISNINVIASYQTFTSSGTWTKPSGLTANSVTFIEAWGGGGGATYGGTTGAGGGGYRSRLILTSLLGATETVTVGSGGSGSAGGNSSFGAFVTAYGGSATAGGGGFSNGGGQTNTLWDGGNSGNPGGSSYYGGGGGANRGGTAGTSVFGGSGGSTNNAGSAPGGGGGSSSGAPNPGGAGGRGEIRVTVWY